MSWSVVVTCPVDLADIVAAELFDLGAVGVESQEPDMVLMPGTPALPAGAARCIAHFQDRAAARDAAAGLRNNDLLRDVEVPDPMEVPAEDWSRAWRKHHRSIKVGPRSWIHPPWETPDSAPGDALVCIDPGMAFGTGQHPTTALCLERLDELLAQRPGADVLDVGTGSGILALGAALLGAGRVCATENDPIALEAARGGAALNGLAEGRIELLLVEPDHVPGAPFGLVVE